uniref:Uncharacterized protein n=1 Tax=Panagrolaimus sp. ES5 TaxID=591445 RepID=A0AC34FQ16_9BILA
MIHLQRPDGVITETVADLMEEIARFYNDLYSSEAGNPAHDRNPNIALEEVSAEELIAAAQRMKSNTAPGADNIPSKVVKST